MNIPESVIQDHVNMMHLLSSANRAYLSAATDSLYKWWTKNGGSPIDFDWGWWFTELYRRYRKELQRENPLV